MKDEYHNKVGLLVDLLQSSRAYMDYDQSMKRELIHKSLSLGIKLQIYRRMMEFFDINSEDLDGLRFYLAEVSKLESYTDAFYEALVIMFVVGIEYFIPDIKIDEIGFCTFTLPFGLARKRISMNDAMGMFESYLQKVPNLHNLKTSLYSYIPKD
jgi:hypothetical protein